MSDIEVTSNEYRMVRLVLLSFLTLVTISVVGCEFRQYNLYRFCIEKADTAADFRACRVSETSSTINEHK